MKDKVILGQYLTRCNIGLRHFALAMSIRA